MPSPTPSVSTQPAVPVKAATPTPSASSAAPVFTPSLGPTGPTGGPGDPGQPSPRPAAPKLTSKILGFIILIKSKTGTLHAVMNLKAGPGALATFEDMEQAVNATTGIPACKTNEYFIIPVGGE